MNISEQTYFIPWENYTPLVQAHRELQQRAQRRCVALPTLQLHGWSDEPESERVAQVSLQGEVPEYAGHRLLAVVVNGGAAGETLVRSCVAENHEQLHELYGGHREVRCAICHTERLNNDGFIVEDLENGELRVIGRNCLQYAFPKENPYKLAAALEYILELQELLADAENAGRWDTRLALCLTARIVNRSGGNFVSLAEASAQGVPATATLVREQLQRGAAAAIPFRPSEAAAADNVLDWLRDLLLPSNDYEWNLRRLSVLSTVEERFLGLLVSAYPAYLRAVERDLNRQQRREQFSGSRHVGTVNEMLNFADVKVLFKKEIASEEFGTSWLYKFLTPDGHLLVAFTRSEDFVRCVETGDTLHLRCKVKKHSEYEGIQQTEVSYLKQITRDYALTGKPTAADRKPRATSKGGAADPVFNQAVAERFDAEVGF